MELFVAHLLSRNIRYEKDLVDQLFNNCEKRLARILLLLAEFGKRSRSEPVVPRINQETLAEMVGTTRSRVSHFMNKFKKQGFINYKNGGALTVHSELLSVVLGPKSEPVIQSGLGKLFGHRGSDLPFNQERLPSAHQEPFRRTTSEETNITLLLSTMRIALSNNGDTRLANDLKTEEEKMWTGRLR